MSQSSLTKLIFATLLVGSILSAKLSRNTFKKVDPNALQQTGGGWVPTNIGGDSVAGVGKVLTLDSSAAPIVAIYQDIGPNVCMAAASLPEGIYTVQGVNKTISQCATWTVTKINKAGKLLFLKSGLDYIYITDEGDFSNDYFVRGDITQATAQGVQYGLTKSTEDDGNAAHDYFRIFSRASDVNGTYPTNFYALVSNSTGDTFTNGSDSILTLKKFDWTFKNTSNVVNFTNIDQVNFVSDHDPNFVLEAQFITGKQGNQPACLYGGVNTRFFAQGPSLNNPNMYKFKDFQFTCNLNATAPTRTYQGLTSYKDALNYFYAINPDTGRI